MLDALLLAALNPPTPIVQENIQISQSAEIVFYPTAGTNWRLPVDRTAYPHDGGQWINISAGTTVRVVELKLNLPAGDFAVIEFLGKRYDVFLAR